ncbi:YegP family protein [uncultured Roseobacter sp.]|uniref:YegP family protein n=1 Tax=uncultured Roseobacter sp. TaxID=114847 RepID=UPI00260B07BB|nr:YegP family protein [uncultured Roseobacter sp.]
MEKAVFYYLYKDVNNHWRWTLYAANNRKIANSGEGYHNRSDAISAIELVKLSSSAPVKQATSA